MTGVVSEFSVDSVNVLAHFIFRVEGLRPTETTVSEKPGGLEPTGSARTEWSRVSP